MTGHPTLPDLMEHVDRPDVHAHLASCAMCRARALMLERPDPAPLPGLDEAREAFAETRRLASLSIGHTWGTDPLREDLDVPPDLEIGRVIERYVVRDRIGAGAMGALYRVEHTQLGSRHALKVLHRSSDAIRGRLMREGRAQSRLQHANVVPVTDVVDIDGAPGLIMELVDGPSLSTWLQEHGPPPLSQVARLGEQIIRAVAAAHDAGIVHRDLKPSNVLIAHTDEGPAAKVCDFGLALSPEDDGGRTGPLGTPGYMAPEQIHDASAVDARSDIFSLGAVLYELATAERAFQGSDLLVVWGRIRAGEYAPPQTLRPDLPDSMLDAIDTALQTHPDARFDDCRELLATWRGGRPLTEEAPRPTLPAPPPAQSPSRGVWVAAALGISGLLAAGGLGMFAVQGEHTDAPDPSVPAASSPATDRGDRRLTAIPSEIQIMALALAADDTQLLYSDGRGLWHQALDTGVTRLVAPGGPYHSLDWLPTGDALVSGAYEGQPGTFRVDIATGTFTHLTDTKSGRLRVAPSGEAAVMMKEDGLWTMRVDGTEERQIVRHTDGQFSSSVVWSPDGRFLAAVMQGGSTGTPTLERIDVADGSTTLLTADPRLVAMGMSAIEWAADDRLVYARTPSRDEPAELRALENASAASSTADSTVLRTWDDYALIRLDVGSERLVASRGTAEQDIWVVDPSESADPTLLTPEDWSDRPIGWGPDGVFFQSNRGAKGIFVLDPEGNAQPTHFSGSHGLAIQAHAVDDAVLVAEFKRPPLPDGSPGELVFQVNRLVDGTSTPLSTLQLTESLGAATSAHALRCSTGRCLVSTPEDGEVLFRWLDLQEGGLSETVTSLPIGARSIAWALSPDAGRIVALVADPAQHIEVDLTTGERRVLDSELDLPLSLAWMPDGETLYASGLSLQSVEAYQMGRLHDDGRYEVLRASMNTNVHTLLPAPDGSNLVLGTHSFGSDLWLLADEG